MYNWEDEGGKKTGRREREREGASETERVKITFVRLPSNTLYSEGWFNPVFPAADPQPASLHPTLLFNAYHLEKQTNTC